MSEWISVEDQLPLDNQYVLVHLTKNNRGDSDDHCRNRYLTVVKFKRGLSSLERVELPDSDDRKRTYRTGDQWDNNMVPYCWDEFGPSNYFGQEVDYWQPLLGPHK